MYVLLAWQAREITEKAIEVANRGAEQAFSLNDVCRESVGNLRALLRGHLMALGPSIRRGAERGVWSLQIRNSSWENANLVEAINDLLDIISMSVVDRKAIVNGLCCPSYQTILSGWSLVVPIDGYEFSFDTGDLVTLSWRKENDTLLNSREIAIVNHQVIYAAK